MSAVVPTRNFAPRPSVMFGHRKASEPPTNSSDSRPTPAPTMRRMNDRRDTGALVDIGPSVSTGPVASVSSASAGSRARVGCPGSGGTQAAVFARQRGGVGDPIPLVATIQDGRPIHPAGKALAVRLQL